MHRNSKTISNSLSIVNKTKKARRGLHTKAPPLKFKPPIRTSILIHSYRSPAATMFSLSSVVFMLMCTSSFSQAYRPLRGRKRILGERVVSTACSKIRNEPYKARLDLLFLYVLEYRTESEIDLLALNSAIANYLISVLNDCDANGQPKFATEIDPGSHTLITTQGE